LPGECWTSDSSALHTDAVPGQIYYYWAKAATSEGGANATGLGGVCSDNSGWRKLSPPTWASITDDLTDGIQMTWTAPAGASAYMVYRNTVNNPSTATPITAWIEQTSKYDSNVEAGRAYYYWVKAAAETDGLRPSEFSGAAIGRKAYTPAPPVEMGEYGATEGTYLDMIKIQWNPILWPQETYYYRVYRSEVPDDGGTIVNTATPISGWQTGTSFDDTTAVPGKDYYYYVSSALSADGYRESAWWLCPYCLDAGWRKLSSAPNVSASDGKLDDRIRVTWSPAEGATHYRVYRSTSATYLPKIPPTLVSGLVEGTQFDDTDPALVAETTYYYWVRSVVVNGTEERESGFVMTGSDGWKAVSAPKHVSATDGTYTDKVRITWELVNGLNQYQVYRSAVNDPLIASPLLKTWQTGNAYNDTSAVRGRVYYYWVQGRVDETDTTPSPVSEPDSGYRALSAPTGVSATDGAHTDKVAVSWSASTSATHYQVYRNTVDNSAGATPVSDWQSTLAFEDTNTNIGITYYYYVAASTDSEGSRPSARSVGDSGYRALAPSVNVMASQGTFNALIGISWDKGSDETTHFRVYRATVNNPDLAQPISGWITERHFEDTSASPGQVYYYWVTGAVDAQGTGESAKSGGVEGFISVNMPGDIDGNRVIQLQDVILALQVCAGMSPQVPLNSAADVNGDGKLSMEEAIYILRKMGATGQ
jgi:fibronectin type 3 domain-containing protein